MHQVAQEVIDAIGMRDAIAFIRRWGGRVVYIQKTKIHASDPLALSLGLDTARKLVDTFGGRELELPAERNVLLDMRNEAIVRDCLIHGLSHAAAGLRYGVTRQMVGHIIKRAKERTEPAER